jgi:hypothetical protein
VAYPRADGPRVLPPGLVMGCVLATFAADLAEPKTPLTSSTPTTSLSLTLSSQLSLASATFYLFKPVYIPPEGLPLSIYVTSADVQDRVGARYLVAGLKPFVPRLTALAGCR